MIYVGLKRFQQMGLQFEVCCVFVYSVFAVDDFYHLSFSHWSLTYSFVVSCGYAFSCMQVKYVLGLLVVDKTLKFKSFLNYNELHCAPLITSENRHGVGEPNQSPFFPVFCFNAVIFTSFKLLTSNKKYFKFKIYYLFFNLKFILCININN